MKCKIIDDIETESDNFYARMDENVRESFGYE